MQNVLDAMPVLERFVVLAYDRTSQCQRVSDARKVLFAQKGRTLENISLLLMQYYSTPREWHTKLNIVGDSVWFLILNYLLLTWISHGPSSLLTDRFFFFFFLRLTVRTFRTGRHSCLRSEYRACISLSHQGQLSTVCTFRTVRHPHLRTNFAIDGPYVSHGPSSLITDHYLRFTVRM